MNINFYKPLILFVIFHFNFNKTFSNMLAIIVKFFFSRDLKIELMNYCVNMISNVSVPDLTNE